MTIRPFRWQDREPVQELARRILGRSVERFPAAWEPAFVADRDGKVVGFVSASLRNGVAEGRNFVLDPSARGGRTLYRLVTALEDALIRAGVWRYRGVIEKTNARFLKAAHGWGGKIVDETPIDYIVEVDLLRSPRAGVRTIATLAR